MQLLRRLITLSFVVVLLIGSTGVSVYSHFCKNDGLDASYFIPVNHSCKKESVVKSTCCKIDPEHVNEGLQNKEIKSDCCQDELKSFKITDHFSQQFQDFKSLFYTLPTPISVQFVYSLIQPSAHIETPSFNRPPPKTGTNLLVLHQVFRI